jgi:hypothetical protein
MTLLQTLAFGLQATWLEHSALDSLEEIEQTQRKRLVELVRHAKQHSAYYGETSNARISKGSSRTRTTWANTSKTSTSSATLREARGSLS